METIISSIRDLLRKEGITGIDSINHCILFVISRLLNVDMCHKFGIDPQYAFNNLLKDENGDEIGDQDLYNRVYNRQKNCLVGQIMYVLGFMNMKFKLEGIHNLRLIYDKLSQFDVEKLSVKYDVIGTIYEIHLKSGTSNSMRDLGQYYTHRQVIQYMINLCDPQMKNGLIEKVVDPTMGTGGFLTMTIKYLNQKYNGQIDWAKNKDHIIGFDIDENVRNMALLNVLLETMELCKETLVKQDTLHYDMKFTHNDTILEKADIILANEPMGLKNIVHAECCERIKEMKIRGTKAEPLFLQLFMSALNDGGRCAVIVPDGVLFNESTLHKGTRKYLVENFNLKKVVSLNDDFFLNTGVKTSILYFTKDGQQTTEVDFSQIWLKNDQLVETSVVKVSYQQIKDSKYSLFVNKYNVEQVSKIADMEYMKFGDLCQKKSGNALPKNQMIEGCYPVISGGSKNLGKHNEYNHDGDFIFIARVGSAGSITRYRGKCYITDLVGAYENQCECVLTNYIYYFLKFNEECIKNMYVKKTGAPSINLTDFSNNFEIPIPPLSVQQAIVERLDVLSRNNETSRHMIEEYCQIMKYYVECQTRHEKEYKLGDVCEFKSGKFNSKDKLDVGKYPFYSSDVNSPVGFSDDYCFDYNKYLILIKDGGAGAGKYGDQIGLGKVFKVHGKSAATSHQLALSIKNELLSVDYLYYYMATIKNAIMDLALYTTGLGCIRRSDLEQLVIKYCEISKQQTIVEYCDNLTQMIDKMEQQIINNNVLMKQIIDNYLNQTQIVNEGQETLQDVADIIQELVDIKHDQEPIKKLPVIQIKPKINVSIVDVPTNGEDLNKLTMPKLREIAKEKGLGGYSKLKKVDLIELIVSK